MSDVMKFDDEAVQRAVEILRRGGLVAIPTETVYGLAADASHGEGVAGIFAAKGRPQFNPLIAHVSGIAMAEHYVTFDPLSRRLAELFWPGPLTIVLPLKDRQETDRPIHPLVTAGLSTLAIRMPHGRVQEVITALDSPVAAPSANTSGRISPTSAEAVAGDLGDKIDLILDAGPCGVGVESTIVKVEGDTVRLLRPGGLAAEDIEAAIGKTLLRTEQTDAIQAHIIAPGMMASHYAPDASMRLAVGNVQPGEALLAFGPSRVAGAETAKAVLNLSAGGNLREAASNLFDFMRKLDATGASTIAVEPIPFDGLGEAINDRLKRAAAPR